MVDMDTLADVNGVKRGKYQPISVSIGRATIELVRDRTTEGKISYLRMNASNILLHKIVINYLRTQIDFEDQCFKLGGKADVCH